MLTRIYRVDEYAVSFAAPKGLGRLLRPPLMDGFWCRLAAHSTVTLFSGDLSVKVEAPSETTVHSAHDGRIDVVTKDGRHLSTRTAPLYLAAAERQGLEVQVVEGYGYPI